MVSFSLITVGASWMERNNGLGSFRGCEGIAVDKNNRLYLAITDNNINGSGGLFISEDDGGLWGKIPVLVDSIKGPIKVGRITGLTISPSDSVYFSFSGVGSNFYVELNICKSILDVRSNTSWLPFQVGQPVSWWMDRALNNIHFAQNGNWHSSYASITVWLGGAYFSEEKGRDWHRIDFGLGLSETGFYMPQHFVENEGGRIFMIQYLDERIYTTDKSLVTNIQRPDRPIQPVRVFPNPVKRGSPFYIEIPDIEKGMSVSLYNLAGEIIWEEPVFKVKTEVIAPPKAGFYIISLKGRYSERTSKITVF